MCICYLLLIKESKGRLSLVLQLGFVAAINLFCSPLSVVFCFQARFCVGRSVHRDYPEFDDTLEGPQFADQSILDYCAVALADRTV